MKKLFYMVPFVAACGGQLEVVEPKPLIVDVENSAEQDVIERDVDFEGMLKLDLLNDRVARLFKKIEEIEKRHSINDVNKEREKLDKNNPLPNGRTRRFYSSEDPRKFEFYSEDASCYAHIGDVFDDSGKRSGRFVDFWLWNCSGYSSALVFERKPYGSKANIVIDPAEGCENYFPEQPDDRFKRGFYSVLVDGLLSNLDNMVPKRYSPDFGLKKGTSFKDVCLKIDEFVDTYKKEN